MNVAGAKTLLSWDRLVMCELVEGQSPNGMARAFKDLSRRQVRHHNRHCWPPLRQALRERRATAEEAEAEIRTYSEYSAEQIEQAVTELHRFAEEVCR